MTTVASAAETRNKSQKQSSSLTSADKDAHSQPSTRHSTKSAFEADAKTDSSLNKSFKSSGANSNGCTSLHQPSSLPPKKNLLQRSNPIDQLQVPQLTSQESTNSNENSCSKEFNNEGSGNLFKTFEESSKTSTNDDSLETENNHEDERNFVIPPSILEDKTGLNENETGDEYAGPQHTPGDLVWARVSGYPWWPSMVTNDPIQNMFFKVAPTASKKCLYHVQFFGSVPERAWINWKNLVKYEDVSQFDTLPTNLNVKAKGKKSGKSEKNEVPPSKKLWWEDSIKEANEARLVDKYIRLDKYLKFKQTDHIPDALFSPTLPMRPKREPVRKRESTTNPESAPKCDTPTKKLKNDPDFIQAIFDLYKSRHLDKAKLKFPDYDDDDLEAFLLLQWKNLDQKIKDKYKKRYENPDEKDSGDETDPGDEETLINRARPLRKCVLTLSTNVYKGTSTESTSTEDVNKNSGPESPNKTTCRKTPPINVPSATTGTAKRGRPAAASSNVSSSSSSETHNNSLVIIPEIGLRSPIPILNDEEALEQANAEGHMDDDDEEITGCPAARKEFICKICETSGELLLCEGVCSGAFHLGCLGLDDVPEGEFKCDECTTGLHSCFVCRRNNGTMKSCAIMYCGKFYHEECLRDFPLARLSFQGELICPLHACASCGFHNRKSPDVYHGKMYRCVRCPVAYHCGETDACLAAGCAIIAPNSIICCKHFMPVKNNKTHAHINVSWCFVCSQGGSLLCCERCPASFHLKCIGLSKLPKDEVWLCNSCRLGLRPRYGDILWVKVQNYRWWPAEVIFPRMIPQKSMEEPHQVGEFIVQLFATKEFHWVHIGRTFLFHENDKNFHEPGEKQYPRNFQQALEKASEILIKRKKFAKQSALPVFNNLPGTKTTKAADLLKPPELPEAETAITEPSATSKRDVDSTGLPLLNHPSTPASRSNTPLLAIAGSSPPAPPKPTRKPGVKPRAQGANFFKTSPGSSASPMKRAKGRPKGSGKKQQQQLVAAAAALMAQIPLTDGSIHDSDLNVNHSFDEAAQKLMSSKDITFPQPRKLTHHSEVKVLPRKDVKNNAQHNPKITNISPPCSPIKADFECYQQQKAKNLEPLTVLTEPKNQYITEPPAPANYKLVYQNSPYGNVQVYSADITEITPCECKATDPDPCGPTSDCWNRLLCVECHPQVCRAGERCSNQRFQKAQYPRFEIVYTANRGYGLKTKAWIRKGDFVNEYCGDLIDIDECQKRLQFQNEIGDLNFYFCVLDKERIIDAGPKGNFSRFMNHSCDPNCETQKWTVNGDIRVGLFALADISPGTELTFNYNMDCLGNSKLKCKCNSPSCSGYIGMKPLKGASNIDKDRKKRRHKKEKAVDMCYRCNTTGLASEMISCGRSFCGKFYHKSCLKPEELQPPQQGLNSNILSTANFECPLHVCDICSKVAVYICSQCDHSTCQEHEKGVMYELDDHTFRCKYHYQLLIEKSRPPDRKNSMESTHHSNMSSASSERNDNSFRTTSPSSASLSHASSGGGGGGGSSSQKMFLPPSYQLPPPASHHTREASPHQHALSSLSTMTASSLDSSYLQKLTTSFSSHASSRDHSDQLSIYMNQHPATADSASLSNNLTASRLAASAGAASAGGIDLEKFAAAAAAAGIIPVSSQLEALTNEAIMGGSGAGSLASNAQAAAASIRQMQQQQLLSQHHHNKQHSSAASNSASKFLTHGDSLINAVLDSRRSSAAAAANQAASSLGYQSSFSNSLHQNPTSPQDIHFKFNNR